MRSRLPAGQNLFAVAIVASISALVLSCCTTVPSHASSSGAQSALDSAGAEAAKQDDILGVWRGSTQVTNCFAAQPGRCGAQQIVTITLIEVTNSTVTGEYKCSYGNQTCLGQNTSGKIFAASLRGAQLLIRVKMPDGTSCMFGGRIVNAMINGAYTCYAGGAIIEQGVWRARQSY